MLGFADMQLAQMRGLASDSKDQAARTGIYLGGYAWLEELRPEGKALTPVRHADPAIADIFADGPPLMRDSTNQGYIHAPSLNHGVTAAILRNGFISQAGTGNPDALAVNLTSERVRTALGMIEGIRGGQGLADLLGYQFERGMHDRHDEAEVDHLILNLRRAFPLRADRLKSTKPPEGVSIEAIEARNVIDGLALVEHIRKTGQKTYPFGKSGLPTVSVAEQAIVNDEAMRLLDSHDAVADLALAEGVHQAVLGNYERVASTYDAYARGNFPPEPEVVRTPLNGTGLTHRLALHLNPAPAASATPGEPSPRAQAEPSINAWLAAMLPAAADVGCRVDYRRAATLANESATVTLADIGVEPIDWLWLIRSDPSKALAELDDRVSLHVALTLGPRPDVPLSIRYMENGGRPFSIFEVAAQVRALGAIVSRARTQEATSGQDEAPIYDKARLDHVRAALDQLHADLGAHAASLAAPLADPVANRAAIVSGIDSAIMASSALLARAAAFSVPASGWGTLHETRGSLYAAILAAFADRVARWDEKRIRFDAHLAEADAALADPASTDDARFILLSAAELTISNAPLLERPALPADFRAHIATVTLPAFIAKRDDLDALRLINATGIAPLIAQAEALLPLSAFDAEELDITGKVDGVITLAQTMLGLIEAVTQDIAGRLARSLAAFGTHDGATTAQARLSALEEAAKAMLGDDFKIVPHFALAPAVATEIGNAHAASLSDAPFAHLAALPEPIDFPVDHWLHGVARVREQPRQWEQAMMQCAALGQAEPELVAMQLPYAAGEGWLGLEFAPDTVIDSEKLLYTAHFAAGAAPGLMQCGLLIDEWTETIAAEKADTGITFHHDRPNNEAPQTMLLVTPPEHRGAWRWTDLVDALNETLDFAKRRAVEPVHLEATPYAPLLPATVMATQFQQLTISAVLALNNVVKKGS
jgi:hypothetical protein